ncbi:methyltransferase domain-containing protein [Oscillatoria sp. FACHB-1407]|uniref:methyltransferase domain-containing protein n=1 Tax=Oscillatoria sp. FACHB-1407 TaxID=2692847 RepID=UPI00168490C7|nr:methyltransferase domain-containing protein [Oscillatoria sp. FACHB-1407]MBD2464551.1 methyltransferase domain-containing protein [Oscillatoria sp. FACHB-1407]
MQFCKVADFVDWNNPDFQAIADLLNLEGKSRKVWEFIQVYRGLKELGLLNGESRGLGLGVGHECLIYAFTNVCGEIVATDLYDSQNWSTASMAVNEVYERSPYPYRRDRLKVQHMDMTQIEYPDASFDFVWSCCSIEHVSSFEDLHQVYAEIHRVLKPGGIAALTTEYNPTDRHSYEPHMLFTDRHWIEHWMTGTNPLVQGFDLLGSVDLSLTPIPENEPVPRRDRRSPIQVLSKDIILNSVSFFLRKAGAFSQPYNDTWLPEDLRVYLAACSKQKAAQPEAAQALFRQLLERQTLEPRLRIATSRQLLASLLEQSNLEAAKVACQQVFPVAQTAEDEDHLLPIAHGCRRVGLFDEAHTLYKRVEQLPGAHINQVVRSIICQAEYFDRQGDVEKALELTQKAYQETSSHTTDEAHKVYFHLGFYNEKLGRLDEAIAHYQSAISTSEPGTKFQNNCHLRLNLCLKRQSDMKAYPTGEQPSKLQSFVTATKQLIQQTIGSKKG